MDACNILNGKTAIFITLGCKLNFAENSTVADWLSLHGVRRAEVGETADICIINTCTVTETANHKSRQAIHKAKRENPKARIVVMGCYAQTHLKDIASLPEVDLIIGMEKKGQVVQLLQQLFIDTNAPKPQIFYTPRKDITTFVPSCSHGTRTRYFLKVQDGCDYFCTYCAIPIARGQSRNGSIASIVTQAEQVATLGGKEIVITGVNIGDFGKSTGESLLELVQALDKVEGIQRYRISSIEPNLLTPELIDFCAQSRTFMPHFHIPLQSGSDEVLRLMHRKYDTDFFTNKIAYIHERMPDAFIGVDIIVGTRGETPELFEQSYQFAQSLDVSQFHVFSYSERPQTSALRISRPVTEQEKHARSQRLIALSEEKRITFYKRHIGEMRTILTEQSPQDGILKGFTDNYIHTEIAYTPTSEANELHNNQLLKVQLIGFNQDQTALIGKIIRVND